jgi:hypothetical protein
LLHHHLLLLLLLIYKGWPLTIRRVSHVLGLQVVAAVLLVLRGSLLVRHPHHALAWLVLHVTPCLDIRRHLP